jgi:hypothetical protein
MFLLFNQSQKRHKYLYNDSISLMKQQEMIEKLTKQLQSLAEELQSLERQFVAKKEQFLKVQGALEALVELSKQEE